MFSFLISLINRIIPKNKNKIIFASVPDCTGNALALYEYMKKNKSNFKLIWITDNIYDNNRNVYKLKSLKGLYHLFTTKHLITTHSNFISIKSKNQILVDLWHGMPLKSIGYFDSKSNLKDVKLRSNKVDYTIATSIQFSAILSASFLINPEKILITGQPRNDQLFNVNINGIKEELNIKEFKKIILFAPTHREYEQKTGDIFDIFGIDDFNMDIFGDLLLENDAVLLIKLHPYEEKFYADKDLSVLPDNIRVIDSEMLLKKNIEFYNLLGIVDTLITDYSSLYFDYLLLNKPIIFIVNDIEIYDAKRSFVLNPLEFWMPGPMVRNFDELQSNIKLSMSDKFYYNERLAANELINFYQDDKSTERLYNILIEKLDFHKKKI